VGFTVFAIDALDELMGTGTREHEYARESWRLRRLGFTGQSEGMVLHFSLIPQDWLRETVRRFLRWRINTGHSASGLHRDLITLTRLARAVTDIAGLDATPAQLDRAVIEGLLNLFIADGLTANGRSIALASVRMFLNAVRQHNWLPGLNPHAVVYPDDMPRRTALPPRALSEFVMAQLEEPANLARIPDERCRLLIPLLMQTGLRQKDARLLPPDCVLTDSRNAPYLRYFNHKMNREALVPISAEMATALAAQRTRLFERHPNTPFLFAARGRSGARAGVNPPSTGLLNQILKRWLTECDVRDEHDQPVHITAHQFRHTLGTRLINNDVPQEIVRQLLDHASPQMTAHYARLHDTTVRDHWERARKVNIAGQPVTVPDDSPLAAASWMKHHLARASMALPNGYCGLHPQRSCPHANACLSCAVFITTPEFLPQHREQLAHTSKVLDTAKARNQLRLVEMNQHVHDNLTNIITALEAEEPDAR
jgi:integrase